jgi:hypothetical protein
LSARRLGADEGTEEEVGAEAGSTARHHDRDPDRGFGIDVADPAVEREEWKARGRGDDQRGSHRKLNARADRGLDRKSTRLNSSHVPYSC